CSLGVAIRAFIAACNPATCPAVPRASPAAGGARIWSCARISGRGPDGPGRRGGRNGDKVATGPFGKLPQDCPVHWTVYPDPLHAFLALLESRRGGLAGRKRFRSWHRSGTGLAVVLPRGESPRCLCRNPAL